MALSVKTVRSQLNMLRPLVEKCSLETTRKWQNKIGALGAAKNGKKVTVKKQSFENFDSAWIIPADERRSGIIMYIHGGGFTCGELDYAKGFGTVLAVECGARVFCPAYRLAPEHPFPAALEDVVCAYKYLLGQGIDANTVTLCGESAGGGLCYSLCLALKAEKLPMPAGIIAISPWTDLTASGPSYTKNKDVDPSMTIKALDFFADCYVPEKEERKNPLVSPLFADLRGMPPSILFVGGDEIMLSDTEELHKKLLSSGCQSKLKITPERWHAYILYGLSEDKGEFDLINIFLSRIMCREKKLRWMRLDNAAKIYPAARSQTWTNVFRLSVTLKEEVDREVLQNALDVTVRRFPSIATKLCKGLFWYYLEELSEAPEISEENSYPLANMSKAETRKCAFRVIVYKNRIAAEFFHSLTDGTGGMIFLKTLTAEYLEQKYGITVPAENGILSRLEEPKEAELEDCFLKYAAKVSADRRENTAWHLSGTPEAEGFLNLTCFKIPVKDVIEKAHGYKVSLTAFLTAVLMDAIYEMQIKKIPNRKKRKPIKVLIPVNLRNLFESSSLRNFALYTTPEIDPRLGRYSIEETCRIVHHHMGAEITPKVMSAKIATNVNCERSFFLRIMPLFIKNIAMKLVFKTVGERKSCLTLSNLGALKVPEVMMEYIDRMDFILGVQESAPHNCGVVSVGDTLYINFIRNTVEPELEMSFFRSLQRLGIPVTVESNQSER
ncbi:MAG: steryl acetyl hydrolase [Ruminococcaceae bacterium]|nr:steryl acetyl hydrolase [Oscillospiraceae bacterium]